MNEYFLVTDLPVWESAKAIAFDVQDGGRRERVFIPKKMIREEGGKTYVSEWIIRKKMEQLNTETAHAFLRDFFDMSKSITEGPKVSGESVPGVIALFDKAAESIKYPKLHFIVDGIEVKARRAGDRSKNPGCVFLDNGVKDFYSPDRKYFGKIDRDGEFTPGNDCPEGVVEMLRALNADPDGTLRDHGKASGSCSACGRELTEKKSVELGIGPVCRQRWTNR
jgi:hypothetical protein